MAKRTGGFIGQDGINAPDPATGVTGTAGDTQVDVSFTSPSDVGGAAITEYRVTDSTGAHTASGSASPITVTGLTNGTSYTFNVWAINPFGWSVASDASAGVAPELLQRAVVQLGVSGNQSSNRIDFFDITTTGNASDFGDLTIARQFAAAMSSETRGIFYQGNSGTGFQRVADYITIASTGNATDYGDTSHPTHYELSAVSNATRGVAIGGYDGGDYTNAMTYSTIATLGSFADFGDISNNSFGVAKHASSGNSTRGIIWGGDNNSNNIEYITISSTGNTVNFGDTLTSEIWYPASAASSSRALLAGKDRYGTKSNVIEYVSISSTGNSSDFGDLTVAKGAMGATRGSTRAVFTGGSNGRYDIDYVTISSTGNAADFGELTFDSQRGSACSSAHGGLS